MLTPRDRDGRAVGERIPVLFARSIHEAVAEKGQPVRGGESVLSKEDVVQTEFYSAARENLTGYVFESEYNTFNKLLGQPEQPFGYEHRFSVSTPKRDKEGKVVLDAEGKPEYQYVQVQFITREELNTNDILSRPGEAKALSMKGAYQMFDYQKKDKSVVRNAVAFEPTIIAKYKEREKEIAVEERQENNIETRNPDTSKGIYKGEIVDYNVQNDIYIQRVGNVEYVHDGADLNNAKELTVGSKVQIAYRNGRASVKELAKDNELER